MMEFYINYCDNIKKTITYQNWASKTLIFNKLKDYFLIFFICIFLFSGLILTFTSSNFIEHYVMVLCNVFWEHILISFYIIFVSSKMLFPRNTLKWAPPTIKTIVIVSSLILSFIKDNINQCSHNSLNHVKLPCFSEFFSYEHALSYGITIIVQKIVIFKHTKLAVCQ